MIPNFPQFKKIEITDKEDIEKFTSQFPHYSDFNFFSIWGWDIHQSVEISKLNENLVICFNDYVSGEGFLSFVGDKDVLDTTSKLIYFSEKNLKKDFLRLIPEEIVLSYKGSNFIARADRNSYDYIYLVEHLANMNNWSQNTSGKRIRSFIKNHHDYKIEHSCVSEVLHDEYKELFRKWALSKNIDKHFELNEFKAFQRFLEIPSKNLRLVSLYTGGVLVGFTLYEILSNGYAISHFAKADKKQHASVYDLLNWEEAKYLHSQGIKYFNWEQDLGIPSLRYAKVKYKPAFFLKKMIIEPKK